MRRRRKRVPSKHYATHKEAARVIIHERLEYWSGFYAVRYNRVSVRDTRTRWGSCSSAGNLNFSYKLLFLPEELRDYVIVHELCHLIEFNHSAEFWLQVARAVPDYRERKRDLHRYPETLLKVRL